MKNTTHLNLFILIIASTLTTQTLAKQSFTPQKTSEDDSIFASFSREESFDITLEADFTALVENKYEGQYQSAKMTYNDTDGAIVERDIRIRARGKYRKKICDIPPITLRFYKKDLVRDSFRNDNKFKLVTHCFEEDPAEAKQNLLKEFLTYKMLNILTESSYQVQLVKVTYINSADNSQFQRLGFIIESTSGLGDRIEGVSKTSYGISPDDLEPTQYHTMTMFQYMVCNTDWQLRMARNVKTFYCETTNEIIVVPYDFDFSGLVDADHAIVNPDFTQKNLRDRIFLGEFNNEQELHETLALFKQKEEEIINLWRDSELLSRRSRRDVLNYINSFYEVINDDDLIKTEFLLDKEITLGE